MLHLHGDKLLKLHGQIFKPTKGKNSLNLDLVNTKSKHHSNKAQPPKRQHSLFRFKSHKKKKKHFLKKYQQNRILCIPVSEGL